MRSKLAITGVLLACFSPSTYGYAQGSVSFYPLAVTDFIGSGVVGAEAAFTAQRFEANSPAGTTSAKIYSGSLGLNLGVDKKLNFSVTVPYIASQNGKSNGETLLDANGVGNISTALKYKVFGDCCDEPYALVLGLDAVVSTSGSRIMAKRPNTFIPAVYLGRNIGAAHDWVYVGYKYSLDDEGGSSRQFVEAGVSKQFTKKLGATATISYVTSNSDRFYWSYSDQLESYSGFGGGVSLSYRISKSDWFLCPAITFTDYNRLDRQELAGVLGIKTVFGGH